MAGTEYSGPEAAIPGLFAGKCCVFSGIENSAPDALGICQKLYAALGMATHLNTLDGAARKPARGLCQPYFAHRLVRAGAHGAGKERDEDRIFELASGGFQSTVRLAKSSPETWIPIFQLKPRQRTRCARRIHQHDQPLPHFADQEGF